MKLIDIQSAAVRELLGTYSVGTPVLAINAGGAATFKTTQSPAASFLGVFNGSPALIANAAARALTALAALQNPITHQDTFYVQPAGKTVYYLVVANAAGTMYTIQGTYDGQVLAQDRGPRGDGSMPRISVAGTYVPVGYIKVVTGSATFTPATTLLDAANITFTFADLNKLGSL